MASRTLQVNITGDPSSFNRALHGIDTTVTHSGKKLQRFAGIGAAALKGVGIAAAGGAALGLGAAAKAAIEAEKSHARLTAQLKASKISYKDHRDEIERVIGATSKLSGLDDEDLTDSFTNIVRITGDVNKSLKLTGLAADFARAKHIDVAKAGEIVGKVAGGNTGILSRYGIQVGKNATASDALAKLQKKFSGQAEAYGKTTAGSMDRAKVASENLGESVGSVMAPLIAKGADALVDIVQKMQEWWPKIKRIANTAFGAVSDAVQTVRKAVTRFAEKNREDIENVVRAFRRVARFARDVFEDVLIPIIKRVAPIVRDMVQGIVQVIRGLIRIVTGIINGDWRQAWEGFKDIFKGSFRAVVGLIKGLWGIVRDAIKLVITKAPGLALDAGKAIVKGIINGIGAIGHAIFDKVKGGINWAADKLKGFADKVNPFSGITGNLSGDVAKGFNEQFQGTLGGGSLGGVPTSGLQIEARQGLGFIQSHFGGVRITSGRRSPAENERVGGAPRSDHLTGLAADLVPAEGWTPGGVARLDRIAAWARNSPTIRWIGWRGVPNHGPGNHLHLSWVDRVAGDVAMIGGKLKGFGGRVRGMGDVSTAARAAQRAGFRGQALVDAVAIAGAETGWESKKNLKYPDHSIGYWQINQLAHHGRYGSDAALMDPFTNAKAAFAISGRGRNFGPWSTWPSAASSFLGQAREAVAGLSSGGAPGAGGGGGGVARRPGGKAGPGRAGVGPGFSPSTSFRLGTEGNLARAGVQRAQAEARDDLSGLIAAMTDERKIKLRRLRRIRRVLKGRIGQKRRTRLMGEEAQLIGEIAELTAAIKEYTADQAGGATTISAADEMDAGVAAGAGDAGAGDTGPTAGDFADAAIAEASLTPGTEDDAAALGNLLGIRGSELEAARASGDPRRVVEAINAYKSVADALEQLNGTIAEANRLQQVRDDLLREQVDNQRKIIAFTNQGPTILAQLVAAINGDIGGRVGLGYQTPGYAGAVARY